MFNTTLYCNMNYIHNCKLTPWIDVPSVGAGKLQLFRPSFSAATDAIRIKSNAKLNFIRTFCKRKTDDPEEDRGREEEFIMREKLVSEKIFSKLN